MRMFFEKRKRYPIARNESSQLNMLFFGWIFVLFVEGVMFKEKEAEAAA